jgi:phage/plasmid-associated DNA primase
MKLILESDTLVPTPEKVLAHSKKYHEGQDILKQFVGDTIEPFEGGVLQRLKLWDAFKAWKIDNSETCSMKKKDFEEAIMDYMDKTAWKDKSDVNKKSVRNFWKGYRFVRTDYALSDDDLD